ncbi:CD3337/EF1877 family mobilome membrane protein [Enterococcus faecalis]|nr:FUSC family protein [Enterococcus faecalis]
MTKKRTVKILLGIVGIFFLLSILSISVNAAGLVDETIDATNNYSKYPIENYQLDYFVDTTWGWLPWNWDAGIGKSVMYGIYAITNFIWIVSVLISYATGYLVGEAYSLDFISDTTEAIGRNIQTLAGINERGFMTTGFYPGLILLLILVLGIYVTYTGLIKRETTKAIGALVSFITIFLLSSSFIAYSTSYIRRINEFSADISEAALDIGSKMTISDASAGEKNSVDAIRDSLFEIQVKQPWMILQYGDSDSDTVGKERVEKLESTSPFENKGKDRIEIIKEEINDQENDNLTITKTINRLGVVVFLFFFNLFISIFVFILTGTMIFSQLLFIIFAIFLPISFLLSMIPSFNHLMKKTIMRLFNVIMMRAGITLILTVSFSLSSMVYSLTVSQPFFIVAFLQIVIFAGIYFKMNDLLGMMSLSGADSQNLGSRVMRKPKMATTRAIRKLAVGSLALKGLGFSRKENRNSKPSRQKKKEEPKQPNKEQKRNSYSLDSLSKKQQEQRSNNQSKQQQFTQKQDKEKNKEEAGRKYKQSQHRKNGQKKLTTKSSSTKGNQKLTGGRKIAAARRLENRRKRPTTSQSLDTKKNRQLSSKTTSLATDKLSKNTHPRSITTEKRPKTLVRGQAASRQYIAKKEKTLKKGVSTKKTRNHLGGKGATRR